MSRTVWFRRGDVMVVALCLLAAALMVVASLSAGEGQRLRITTPTQELVFPLTDNREVVVCGRDGQELLVCIEDGAAFVRSAPCSDQVCVQTGRLTKSGQTAACLPTGILLTVEGGKDAPDAVAR